MSTKRRAAIVTVGSELVDGLRIDTNTAEIARTLNRFGFRVVEAVSVGDHEGDLTDTLRRLTTEYALVVTTGGLGPTHDDVTRDAAATALGAGLRSDPDIVTSLQPVIARHGNPLSAPGILGQALVLDGAEVITPTTGTAPGQIVPTPGGQLLLLPGPPSEMRPMLDRALARFDARVAEPRELGVTGMGESDVQHAAQRALSEFDGIVLTVLAKPGDVRVLLIDDGVGERVLDHAASAIESELGDACYSTDGSSLAQALVAACTARGLTIALAESCTGGLAASAITDVPGASAVLSGGVVTYSDKAKQDLLGVGASVLEMHGAVSADVAREMAEGARSVFDSDLAVAITGIAGPEGGSPDKPVGLVWFAVATAEATRTIERRFAGGDRGSIRARATSAALDLLRLTALRA